MRLTRVAKAAAIHRAAQRALAAGAAERQARWEEMMGAFHRDWPAIKAGPRVIIHLPSLSY